MSGPTKGMGQQNGDAHVGGNSILEISQWTFEPTQKLGQVVTNATGGFEGQIESAPGGSGSVTIIVPKTGYTTPLVMGQDTVLDLYADAARLHGFTNIVASFDKASVKIKLTDSGAIAIKINFRANGPYDAIGAFAILGNYNNVATSSSGT